MAAQGTLAWEMGVLEGQLVGLYDGKLSLVDHDLDWIAAELDRGPSEESLEILNRKLRGTASDATVAVAEYDSLIERFNSGRINLEAAVKNVRAARDAALDELRFMTVAWFSDKEDLEMVGRLERGGAGLGFYGDLRSLGGKEWKALTWHMRNFIGNENLYGLSTHGVRVNMPVTVPSPRSPYSSRPSMPATITLGAENGGRYTSGWSNERSQAALAHMGDGLFTGGQAKIADQVVEATWDALRSRPLADFTLTNRISVA